MCFSVLMFYSFTMYKKAYKDFFTIVTFSASCTSTEFECNNHQCVPNINRCDGTPQCRDKSDEFRCGNIHYLSTFYRGFPRSSGRPIFGPKIEL